MRYLTRYDLSVHMLDGMGRRVCRSCKAVWPCEKHPLTVGEPVAASLPVHSEHVAAVQPDHVCAECGYHVCACEADDPLPCDAPPQRNAPYWCSTCRKTHLYDCGSGTHRPPPPQTDERRVMKKPFNTLAVLGAWSGFCLEKGGMGGIHEVMDHLFPGIMTIGVAAMLPIASKHLARTVPGLAEFPEINGDNWQARSAEGVARFGATIDVDGPLNVSDSEISAAYDKLMKP